MEITSKEVYAIYRQVEEIQAQLEETDKFMFNDAIEIAKRLSDELFACVGKAAAFEIDNEYWNDNRQTE